MTKLAPPLAITATLFAGAIFGFFYAWVCSTMWGLDVLDPRIAIAAMNGMNGSVRNAVFAPAFFGTPVVLGLAAVALQLGGQRGPARYFAAATAFAVFSVVATFTVNVPMNEALAIVDIPDSVEAAQTIWAEYSGRWQMWNQTRTVTSAIALALAAIGLAGLSPARVAGT